MFSIDIVASAPDDPCICPLDLAFQSEWHKRGSEGLALTSSDMCSVHLTNAWQQRIRLTRRGLACQSQSSISDHRGPSQCSWQKIIEGAHHLFPWLKKNRAKILKSYFSSALILCISGCFGWFFESIYSHQNKVFQCTWIAFVATCR